MGEQDFTRSQDNKDAMLLTQKRYRSFLQLVLMVLNICMGPFYFGYTIQYMGTFDWSVIKIVFNITMSSSFAQGLYNGLVPIGGGIGALGSFLLLKNLSRRNCFLVINAIALVFGGILFIQNQYVLILARFMQGVCVGLYSAISPLIIKQFSPNELSGTLGSMNQFFIAFGVFFACLLQLILAKINGDQYSYWQLMFGFTLITVSVQTLLFLIVYRYETPKQLLLRGDEQECRKVLSWIYLDEYVEDVLIQKKADLGIKQSVVSQPDFPQQNRQTKVNKLRLAVAVHLAILQQFIGINAVVIYATGLAKQILPSLQNVIPVILNLQQTVTPLVTGYLLTRMGRKTILQAGTGVGVVALVVIGVGFLFLGHSDNLADTLVIIGLVVFMANFGMSLGPIVWLYIPEILEPNWIPVSTAANWASATFITFLFPIIKEAMGTPAYLFLFYAAYSTGAFFFSQKFLIETRDKKEKQIYAEYEQLSA